MEDKEVNIGGRKYSANTPVVMNLWTFIALIGVMFGIFYFFYNDVKTSNASLKTDIGKITTELNDTNKILFEVKGQVNNMKQNVDLMVKKEIESHNR